MLFNSPEFMIFFPIIFILMLLIKGRLRWGLLLVASYYFYMSWRIDYIVLILISTVIDYIVTWLMDKTDNQRSRTFYLIISLIVNLGLLFWFKYLAFFAASTNQALMFIGVDGRLNVPALLLPVGISFYTFQTLSYTVDVYQRKIKREPNLIIFALFVSYFPQLVAGPIERSKDLLPQLRALQHKSLLHAPDIAIGLRLMAWGMFKKIVVADRLALYVNPIYSDPDSFRGAAIILATIFFAFQIYCDFSGYSDIAIGAARILGVKLSQNFNAPYFARSIADFWQRWHITLSTWFRDYLYIPLGGNRVSEWRWQLNIIIVFAVSGLWHGASWTFIVWGLIHGIMYLINHYLVITLPSFDDSPAIFKRMIHIIQMTIIFVIVCIAWMFFRAANLTDVITLMTNAIDFSNTGWQYPWQAINVASSKLNIILCLAGMMIVIAVDALQEWIPSKWVMNAHIAPIRYIAYGFLLFAIAFFGLVGGEQQFVYFQF